MVDDNDVSVDELAAHVRNLHGVQAEFIDAVNVEEKLGDKTVWKGVVKVFDVSGHPSGATRCYAWSYAAEGTKRRFVAVLGLPPVVDARTAVQAAIVAQYKKTQS